MAIVSKFSHASATVDLNDVNTGFSLAGDGWLPAVATPVYGRDPEPVTETLHLNLKNTSQDAVAASMQALHFMQVQADAYINDPTVDDPVWLHAKMNSETGERRAVVYKIEAQFGASWYGDEATSLDIPVTLSVTRGPYWESTTARDLPYVTGLTGMMSAYDYSASGASIAAHDIVGDVGARVRYFSLESATTQTHSIYWMGLRTSKHGTLANFITAWEFEDGTLLSGCVTAADTGASGGGYVVASGASWDDTFYPISVVSASDVTANPTDQGGKFMSISRSKTNDTSVWNIRFRYGNDLSQLNYGNITSVSASSTWTVNEQDIYKLPIMNEKSITSDDYSQSVSYNAFAVRAEAKRVSGTGALYLDCFAPLPVDEGFLKITSPVLSDNPLYFGKSPTGESEGTTYNYRCVLYDNDFSLPPGDGRIYLVSAGNTDTHRVADTITINSSDVGKYYERWLSLRGTE